MVPCESFQAYDTNAKGNLIFTGLRKQRSDPKKNTKNEVITNFSAQVATVRQRLL